MRPLRQQGTFKEKLNAVSSSVNFKNNELNIIAGSTTSNYDHKTFIRICYDDNKLLLANSYCSCLHLLNYIKEKLNLNKDDQIDLIDFDGNLKEIPSANNRQYAIQFIVPTSTYIVLKIERDPDTNEKKYYPIISDNKLNPSVNKTLTNLNNTKVEKKPLNKKGQLSQNTARDSALKQGLSTPTSTSSSQSNTLGNSGIGRKKSMKV